MQPDEITEQLGTVDDTHVMRYLLHTIKGISPVSGGEMGDQLQPEYVTEEDTVI